MIVTAAADATIPGAADVTVDLQGVVYPEGTLLSVTRLDVLSGDTATVYDGAYESPVTDLTIPLGRNIIYTAAMGSDSASSAALLVDGLPVVSNEDGTGAVAVSIYDWPELDYVSQTTIVRVPGRADPIAVLGVEQLPSSTVTIVTLTDADLAAFRDLVAVGNVLLVRAPCAAIESAYFVITQRAEKRITKKGTDWRRLHECQIEHIGIAVYPGDDVFPADNLYPSPGQ